MSKPTLVCSSDKQVLEYLKRGVKAISIPVSRTLGPEAKTTLMYRTYNRGPRNVDDGYYTSEVILPKHPFIKLVAEFFKEAVMRTNRKVGDGTSGTACVARALFNDIYAKLQAKSQGYFSGKSESKGVMQLKKDILEEAKKIKEEITKVAKPIKTLAELEKISAVSLGEENDTSKLIAKMAYEVGVDGFLDVVEGYKGEIETEIVKGHRFHAKICGKAFVNKPERYEMVIEDCPVFITNHKMDNDVLARIVISEFKSTKAILFAPDFSENILVNMVLARQNGTFLWPVKVPGLRTEQLEDLAIFCGATLIDKNKGMKLEQVTKGVMGFLEKLIVKDTETKEDAVALGGRGEQVEQYTETERVEGKKQTKLVEKSAIQKRIEILKGQLEETKEPQFQMLMKRRIASMASAGGVIRVGSPTDAESLPLKLKIEDTVFACRAALKSGYVKGGGLCLKEIADKLPENHILKEALLAPYKQIQENAGGNLDIGKDIIDPADAVYYTVEHATSVVASLITVGNLIAEEEEMQAGEGEMQIAKAINGYTMLLKKEKGIMSENERLASQDMSNGLTDDEQIMMDNG